MSPRRYKSDADRVARDEDTDWMWARPTTDYRASMWGGAWPPAPHMDMSLEERRVLARGYPEGWIEGSELVRPEPEVAKEDREKDRKSVTRPGRTQAGDRRRAQEGAIGGQGS